jgi:DNA replication protein DnaC/predicted GIY-YIG superfamily endonuclease
VSEKNKELMARFLVPDRKCQLPIVWHNSVNPSLAHCFLLHILLSMGHFSTEIGLMFKGDIKSVFCQARLITSEANKESILAILKEYVTKQLVFMPGGSVKFDRYLIAAYQALRQIISNDGVVMDCIPPCLYTKLQQDTSNEVKKYIQEQHRIVLRTTLEDLHCKGITTLPSFESLEDRSEITPESEWNGDQIPRGTSQTEKSFDEQNRVRRLAQLKLDEYTQPNGRTVRNPIVTGGPGVGKTTCTEIILLMAMSRALVSMVTALMSVRAKQLGGRHLSYMLCIPVKEYATPQRLAELALMRLFRMPKLLALLRQIDVLLIDEFGLMSARMLLVIDIIFRRVRDCSAFMGGILVISTLDHLQIHAIEDRPVLMSPHIWTCFDMWVLMESIQASNCTPLQQIQGITRLPRSLLENKEKQDEFRYLLRHNCTHHADESTVPLHILFVLGKKIGAQIAQDRMLRLMRIKHGSNLIVKQSEDVKATPEGCWVPASEASSKILDRQAKEPRNLCFFPRALYEVTFNDPHGQFSQSQLALLHKMPLSEDIEIFRSIELLLAPNGCKIAPSENECTQSLTDKGWTSCVISVTPDRPHNLRYGIQGKRKQYGLKHRIAITMHGAMGQDLGSLVTRVTLPTTDARYSLWLPSQVVVLLSRTFYAKDIHFIGNIEETIEALLHALLIQSQYTEYMSRLIGYLSGLTLTPTDIRCRIFNVPRFFPFRMSDLPILTDTSGTVYVLLSLQDMRTMYIGQTKHLNGRIVKHNSNSGRSHQTADPTLQPWALLCIVCGFEGNRTAMMNMESAWEKARKDLTRSEGPLSPHTICNLGKQLLTIPCYRELRFIICGVFYM